jgi:putative restriction endonuclease
LKSSIKDVVEKVAKSAAVYYETKGAVRSSDPLGVGIISSLRKLKVEVELLLEANSIKFAVSISKGQSNIPRILYVAISRVAERLSTEPSACICFNEKGTGFVVGMMYPMSYLRVTKFQKVKRDPSDMLVDLSSKRSKSNFNNLFVNPKEFLIEDYFEDLFIEHLMDSVGLLKAEVSSVN